MPTFIDDAPEGAQPKFVDDEPKFVDDPTPRKAVAKPIQPTSIRSKSLDQSVIPPTVARKPVFAKGTQPKSVDSAPPGMGEYPNETADDTAQRLESAMDQRSEQAAEAITQYPSKATEQWINSLKPEDRVRLARVMASAPVHDVGSAAQFIGDVVELPLEGINATLRDMATGTWDSRGDMVNNLAAAIKHPQVAAQFLDQLRVRYEPNSLDETAFWMSRPGLRDSVLAAKNLNIGGQGIQTVVGLRADLARFNFTHPGIAALETAGINWFNPGNRIPGAVWKLGAKLVVPTVKTAAKVGRAVAPGVADTVDKATSTYVHPAYNWMKEQMPVVGGRFEGTYRKAKAMFNDDKTGRAAAAEHHLEAFKQTLVPLAVHNILGKEGLYGNMSIPERQRIWEHQDLFNNPEETARLHQPQGGDPKFDPMTRTLSMQKGGVPHHPDSDTWVKEVEKHVFVQRPVDQMKPPKVFLGNPLNDIIPPNLRQNFDRHVRAGDASAALQSVGIPKGEADGFAAQMRAQIPANTRSTALALPGRVRPLSPNERTMLTKRVMGEWMRRQGIDNVEWHHNQTDKEIIFAGPQRAIRPDLGQINGTTVFEHQARITHAMASLDEAVKAAAPSAASTFVQGYHARGGMFKEQETPDQQMNPGRTAASAGKAGGSGLSPGAPERTFASVRQARAAGMQVDAHADPAVALHTAMVRGQRFLNYTTLLQRHAAAIEYGSLVGHMQSRGYTLFNRIAPLTPEMNMGGLDGKKAFETWLDKTVQPQMQDILGNPDAWRKGIALTPAEKARGGKLLNTLPDEELAQARKAATQHIYRTIRDHFSNLHPDRTFETADDTGVDDLDGSSVPRYVVDMAVDSHPVFDQGVKPGDRSFVHTDVNEHPALNFLSSMTQGLRLIMLSDPLYHPGKNLAWLALNNNLAPHEIAQALIAPESVDNALVDEMREHAGGSMQTMQHGIRGRSTQIRYAYARGPQPVNRDLWGAPKKLLGDDRTKNNAHNAMLRQSVTQAYSNASGDYGGFGKFQHALGLAFYDADKWNKDLTFGVFEDTLSAKQYAKFRDANLAKGYSASEARAVAGYQTRVWMGNSLNVTPLERRLGLTRIEWFYTWLKGQFQLWARNPVNARVIGTQQALRGGVMTYDTMQGTDKNPEQSAQRGELDVSTGGGNQQLNIQPGPVAKYQAVSALAATPFTAGEGLKDFAHYATSAALSDLGPGMKLVFNAMMAARQGFGPPKAGQFDPNLPVGQQAMGAIGGALTPPNMSGPMQAAQQKDPIYLLNALGISVKNLDNQGQRIGQSALLKKLDQIRSMRTENATGPADRQQINQQYGSQELDILQQLQQLQGR